MVKKSSKQKLNLDHVLTKVVGLLTQHDPKKLTFSNVSRWTKVPRTTLYYYFGKSRENLMQEAIRFGMRSFLQVDLIHEDVKSSKDWQTFQKNRIQKTINLIYKFPWAPQFYFKYRTDQGKIGNLIRETEKDYLTGIQSAWEHYHQKPANTQAIRLSSYLKIGFIYGLAVEKEIWEGKKSELLKNITNWVTHVMKVDI